MFFRVKLVSIFLTVVLLLVVLVHLLFLRPISEELEEQVEERVSAGVLTAPSLNRMDIMAIRQLAEDVAGQSQIVDAMSTNCREPGLIEREPGDLVDCIEWRHHQVRQALEEWYRGAHAAIQSDSQGWGMDEVARTFPILPSLLIVADAQGVVVGRAIGDTEDWWGEGVQNLSAFYTSADRGTDFAAIGWQEEGRGSESQTLTLVGISPIGQGTGSRSALGVVLVGFPLNDDVAKDKQSVLSNVSFAYTLDDTIAGTDLGDSEQRALLGATYTALFGNAEMSFVEYNNDENTRNQLFVAESSNGRYVVARGSLPPGHSGAQEAGFLVAANLTESTAIMRRVAVGLPLLGIIMLAIGLVLIIMIVRNFLSPLIKVDQGIQQVIMGNTDYVWDVNSKNPFTTEMAHALNVMSAFLQGKPLPDDDLPKDDSEWAALLQFADVEVTGSHPAINVKGLAQSVFQKTDTSREQEPVERFYRRIFDEYVAARKRVDPDGDAVTYDRFVGQVKRNAAAFKKKHNCRDVRFEVVLKDERVLLKPIPIK